MNVAELTQYLDELLRPSDFDDITYDGLQVEGKTEVRKAGFAVDSALEVFERAIALQCDVLVVHHGLIWRGWNRIAGMDRRRIRYLLDNGLNLYVSHIPLDFHPEVGNNASIARLLGAKLTAETFYEVGRVAKFDKPVSRSELASRIAGSVGKLNDAFEFGAESVSKIAVCSGSYRASKLPEIAALGVDTLVTGEGESASMYYYAAREMNLNVYMAGHYATELTGIKSLMERVTRDVKGLETVLIDMPTGM
jgi:dinuclear metal center YbgI/SA1388 family protein